MNYLYEKFGPLSSPHLGLPYEAHQAQEGAVRSRSGESSKKRLDWLLKRQREIKPKKFRENLKKKQRTKRERVLLQVFLFESAAKEKVLRTREGSSFDFDLLGGGTCCARQGNNLSKESA